MSPPVTRNTDSIQTAPGQDGLDFKDNYETLTISTGVLISSETGYGIFSGFHDDALLNKGNILSAGLFATYLGDDSRLINAAGALISGHYNGAGMAGSGKQVVDNSGKIIGLTGHGVYFGLNTESIGL